MKAAAIDKRCIACGGVRPHAFEPLRLVPDDLAYAGHLIAVCSTCGLRSSHPMPDREELRRWYTGGRGVPDDRPGASGLLRTLWHRLHDRSMARLVARHAPGGTLLDVGAGSGRFVREAKRTGRWKVIATEYAEVTVADLRSESIDARQGNLDEVDISDHSIDVVWASHLLEHIPDVEDFLATVRRVLRPAGVLATLVPSEESLRARLGVSTWHHVNPPGHLWGFRPETLRRILESNGFVIELQREVHIVCEMLTIARSTGGFDMAPGTED